MFWTSLIEVPKVDTTLYLVILLFHMYHTYQPGWSWIGLKSQHPRAFDFFFLNMVLSLTENHFELIALVPFLTLSLYNTRVKSSPSISL